MDGRSDAIRSGIRSALGPVGGATGLGAVLLLIAVCVGGAAAARGTVVDGAGLKIGAEAGAGTTGGAGTGADVGAGGGTGAEWTTGAGAAIEATGGPTGTTGAALLTWTCLEGDGAAAIFGFTSGVGFLQSLDPNAGTAAGGDEGRGAYLSLDASARLANKRSSFPGSRRESLLVDGSTATEERREYESV
jgi:hypothetical protein